MVPVSWWRNKFVAGAAATRRVRSILRRDHGSAKNQQAASPPSARPELLPRPRPGGGSRPMYDIPRTKVSSPAPRGERTPCSPRQRAPLQGTLRTDCGLHCGWKAACVCVCGWVGLIRICRPAGVRCGLVTTTADPDRAAPGVLLHAGLTETEGTRVRASLGRRSCVCNVDWLPGSGGVYPRRGGPVAHAAEEMLCMPRYVRHTPASACSLHTHR